MARRAEPEDGATAVSVARRDVLSYAMGRSPGLQVAASIAFPGMAQWRSDRSIPAYRCGGSAGFEPASRFTHDKRVVASTRGGAQSSRDQSRSVPVETSSNSPSSPTRNETSIGLQHTAQSSM